MRIRGELARETPDNLAAQANYGVTLALCGGSRAEALKIADALARVSRPFLHGEHYAWRGIVLAASGDRDGAMRAFEVSSAQGYPWNGTENHLNIALDSMRDHPRSSRC